jgi:epoxyqueuosine reductase
MEVRLHFVDQIKARAAEAGFELCGVASVLDEDESFPELKYFPEWVAQGQAGEMEYLKARNEHGELKRSALAHAAPWAKSVIICAINYNSEQPYSIEVDDPLRGWISRYAWFEQRNQLSGEGSHKPKATDYHDAVLARLRKMEAAMLQDWQAEHPETPLQTRCYVDTGPLVERVYAKYAGVGWVGKNTCIINQQIGSWIFLGSILTSIDFRSLGSDADVPQQSFNIPAPDRCGSCTRCIDACPTDALIAPYKMDARRCIAYLTIEKRGEIPEEFRSAIGKHVFGCDICQDVCPWNGNGKSPARFAEASGVRETAALTHADEFHAREELVAPTLECLAEMSREEFNQAFRGSPIKRAKYEGIRRNTAIAMGNSGNQEFVPLLEEMAKDPDTNVAEHARWALNKLLKE